MSTATSGEGACVEPPPLLSPSDRRRCSVVTSDDEPSLAEEGLGGVGGGSPSRESRVDESHRAALASLEAERRREMERVMLREQQLEGEVGELRRKETGAAARIRNLEADVKSKKEKLKQLLDKSDADDELVHALQIELQKLRKGGMMVLVGMGSQKLDVQPILTKELDMVGVFRYCSKSSGSLFGLSFGSLTEAVAQTPILPASISSPRGRLMSSP